MAFYDYALEFDSSKAARSQGYDLNGSYKDLTQVCGAIRGKPYAQAVKMLQDALSLAKPLPYSAHAKGTSHKSGLGGKRGRYPQNESRYALALLKNAFANAQSKGLDEKTLIVVHAQAYKQNVFPRYKRYFASSAVLGYGKNSTIANYSTARVELVLGPKGLKALPKKTKAQKAVEKKRKAAEKKAAGEKARKAEKPVAGAKNEEKPVAGARNEEKPAAENAPEQKKTEAKPVGQQAADEK